MLLHLVSESTVDIAGTNASAVLLNCSANDGAQVEDIYSIARGIDARTINLYFSGSTDYLRADEATFIGQFRQWYLNWFCDQVGLHAQRSCACAKNW